MYYLFIYVLRQKCLHFSLSTNQEMVLEATLSLYFIPLYVAGNFMII